MDTSTEAEPQMAQHLKRYVIDLRKEDFPTELIERMVDQMKRESLFEFPDAKMEAAMSKQEARDADLIDDVRNEVFSQVSKVL
jgi:hypothetical protein